MRGGIVDLFESVRVVNLKRRPRNLGLFFERLPEDWPFRRPVASEAVDGGLTPPPKWWRGGEGAWGCYRSHLAIIEECLNRGIDSVLIMEDDASFVENFGGHVEDFFGHLPDDWGFVYIGGQHIQYDQRLPRKVNDFVYMPFNINRTHFYGLRGRRMMELVYKHLNNFQEWHADHHIDHHLGELHKVLNGGLYAPRRWLSGQIARVADASKGGASDVNFGEWPELMPAGAEELTYPKVDLRFAAVTGPFGSGTNLLAGLLHFLGVSMGPNFPDAERPPGEWQFEMPQLGDLCRMSFREPWLVESVPSEDRVNLLRRWAGDRCNELRGSSTRAGGYHPTLGLMIPEILEAWADPVIFVIDRPISEAIDRVVDNRLFRWPEPAVRYALPMMAERCDSDLAKYAPRHERISFHRMIAQPREVIDRVSRALDHEPTEVQIRAALGYIRQVIAGLPVAPAPAPTPAGRRAEPFFIDREVIDWATTQPPRLPDDPADPRGAADRDVESAPAEPARPFAVACVGAHCCGADLIGEAALRLGVRMVGLIADSGRASSLEDRRILTLLERYLPYPGTEKLADDDSASGALRDWLDRRGEDASDAGTIPGLCHPNLCALLGPLHAICGDHLYVLNCQGPVESSIDALVGRDGGVVDPACLAEVQRFLTRRLDESLAVPGISALAMDVRSLLEDPTGQVRRLASFLPIFIDEARISATTAWAEELATAMRQRSPDHHSRETADLVV